jgi:hypothetical protein
LTVGFFRGCTVRRLGALLIVGLIALRAQAADDVPTSAPAASRPAKPLTIGKDTTRITGPLRADGTVDYVAALNAQMSQGITPANNAAVGLLRALGPAAFLAERPRQEKLFQLLGIGALPADGDL